MYENVSKVGAMPPTEGNTDEYTLVSTEELNRLKRERDEYREIAITLGESVPKMKKILAKEGLQ